MILNVCNFTTNVRLKTKNNKKAIGSCKIMLSPINLNDSR